MNKKLLAIGSAIVVVLLTFMLVFIFTTEPTETKAIDISGAWQMSTQTTSPDTFEKGDGSYFLFKDGSMKLYKNGELSAESSYTLSESNILTLNELGKEYTVLKVSDNNLKLCPDSSNLNYCINILRFEGEDFKAREINAPEYIKGTWRLTHKAGEAIADEVLVFDGETLSDYRNNAEEPFVTAAYYFDENGILCCNDMNQKVEIISVNDSIMFFVETETGFIWELQRQES